ncbi:MAG: chromosome segregation protein SMC [Bacteroidota bacterium]
MYLSKIEILGFKSFAQKINLSFDAGITSIVGPNGCGKTNVVDAIRWALGEQRPTTLRSDKMEDVIFNGTKSRKPVSMAEVSLTIENTKGILPTEFSEVTITRRVYRSGESEYYLNKTLCRLKDIRDLFMDTGMGSDAYSVIELKMVETILSDKADERRRLFEEAAGVTKYKHRRKEAHRRLESVQVDLTRVTDIVREVQKAVNSLERQAQKAERYNAYAKELHESELQLMSREYSSIFGKIDPLKEQLNVAVDVQTKIDVELKQEEALLDVLRAEMRELEDRSAETQTALTRQLEEIHQLEQAIATGTERRRALASNIERYEKERIELVAHREHREQKLEELKRDLETAVVRTQETEAVYGRSKTELDAFDVQVFAKKSELKAHQDRVIGLLHEISDLKNRENQAKARIENLKGRIEFIAEENTVLQQEILKNKDLVATLSAEDRELRRKFAEAEVRVHEMEDVSKRKHEDIEKLRERDFELRSAVERKSAKMDFLKSLVESQDGLSEGAGSLLQNPEWSGVIQSTVGDALTTEAKYSVALEAALGEAAGYVVVDSTETAYKAIDFLKSQKKGKATFVCLDKLPPPPERRESIASDGVVAWAYELAQSDAKYGTLTRVLFDGVLVVQDLASARAVVASHPSVRCVTLDGELVGGHRGVVKGGSPRSDEGRSIGRKNQIEELRREMEELDRVRGANQSALVRMTEEAQLVDARQLKDEAREIEQQTTTVEVRIAQIEFEKKRALETVERGNTESLKLRHEIEILQQELSQTGPVLNGLEEQKAEAERQSGSASSELETMEALLGEFARKANDANVDVLSSKAEQRSVEQEIQHANAAIRSLQESFDQRGLDIASAKEEIEILKSQLAETGETLAAARESGEQVKKQKKIADQEYGEKRSQVHEIELKLKDERLKHEGTLKSAHDLEFKIQELTMKAQGLKVRAQEEFEVDLQQESFEDLETFDFAAAREAVRSLKEKLRALGAVNFAAYDEYKSEKERLDFINAQRNDLEESEKTLLSTIEEINTTAQKQFLETFELIRENFITTFKGLFDQGDECDLALEEGVDPLEARIEITAKPRGKRPTSIDLLSGGEKTLTAIALLFAIYLVKPSPFCILDEVDAPLDDSNIDRFTRILKKFSDDTQFIVVTHNKRTMEAANALYGVTMEEEGVSKLVSVRFDQPVAN